MYKMVTMVPPGEAVRAGVRVCRLLQKPGTFVVTWPRAYHAGFSHGFNTAEAVNFMLTDWLPYAKRAADWYRTLAREPVLDLEQARERAPFSHMSHPVFPICQE